MLLRVVQKTLLPTLVALATISGGLIAQQPPGGRGVAPRSRTVVVPSVLRLAPDSAERLLARAGLTPVRITRRVPPGVAVGIVVAQSPDSGQRVLLGTVDTIFVSTLTDPRRSAAFTRVPSLFNLRSEQVDSALTQRRLRLGAVTFRSSAAGDDGRVVAQSLRADSAVVMGTPVDVTFGRFFQPAMVRVPPLVGARIDIALSRLREMGLQLGAVSPFDSVAPSGTIVSQRPPPRTAVQRGSAVSVDTSTGMIIVPDLFHLRLSSARDTIRGSGLRFTLRAAVERDDPVFRDSIVTDQVPRAGTRARPGTTVAATITFFSQARRDSIDRARRDSVDRARRDSVDRIRRDSLNRARQDSIDKVQRDSVARARRDSIDKAHRDSVRIAQRDSAAKVRRDSAQRVADSIARVRVAQRDSLRFVRVPDFTRLTLADARRLLGDSLRLDTDARAGDLAIVRTQTRTPGSSVLYGTIVGVGVKRFDWFLVVLIAAGVVVVGGVAVLIARLLQKPTPTPTPSQPQPQPHPSPVPRFSSEVELSAPSVTVHSDANNPLREHELEFVVVDAPVVAVVFVDAPSIILEESPNARR